uniref:Uncharacterized protein n=1 Tax=Oryza glumipatula TaxID=40148 RepID=A0A0E0BHQ0_9ORYZ
MAAAFAQESSHAVVYRASNSKRYTTRTFGRAYRNERHKQRHEPEASGDGRRENISESRGIELTSFAKDGLCRRVVRSKSARQKPTKGMGFAKYRTLPGERHAFQRLRQGLGRVTWPIRSPYEQKTLYAHKDIPIIRATM